MNLEKFTDRAKGFLQSAQTVAIRLNNQQIAPEHILKALLEDEQGMAAGLIQAAGGDPRRAVTETDLALSKIPAVSGSGAQSQPGLNNDSVRVLDQAEQKGILAAGGGAAERTLHLDSPGKGEQDISAVTEPQRPRARLSCEGSPPPASSVSLRQDRQGRGPRSGSGGAKPFLRVRRWRRSIIRTIAV